MGCRVLLTGGSGFLGCYVMKALIERGDIVVNFDIRPPADNMQWLLKKQLEYAKFEEGNIEDASEIVSAIRKHKIEKIVHGAAIVDPRVLLRHPPLAYRINLGGTINVLEAARAMGISKVVYISSNGVFTRKQYEPIDEEHPVLLPDQGPGNGPYSTAKIASEAFGLNYADIYNTDFISLRPSAIYGFGMQYPMYLKPMVENSIKKMPTRFDSGREFPRDYTYVEDVAAAVLHALDCEIGTLKDRIFIIATGQKLVTAGDLEGIVKELIPGADIEVKSGLTEWNKKEIRYRGLINISRARKQLGYEPKHNITDGIKKYIAYYRDYLSSKEKS